jgi:hypothetical protein
MARVEKNAEVTLVALVYRDMRWLRWCIDGNDSVSNLTPYRWLIVANDATDEVVAGLQASDFDWVDHRNEDPQEHYIARVYEAWNRGVIEAPTQQVIMLNSDMVGADYWVDELMDVKRKSPDSLPASLLVESGRIPSAMPEYVRNFGLTPDSFDAKAFAAHAHTIRQPGKVEPGRLYMPVLVDRQEFVDVAMYPHGNPPGTTGDKDLFLRYAEAGHCHLTALGSVVYHVQEGEMRS